jgi:hypothetical protein
MSRLLYRLASPGLRTWPLSVLWPKNEPHFGPQLLQEAARHQPPRTPNSSVAQRRQEQCSSLEQTTSVMPRGSS